MLVPRTGWREGELSELDEIRQRLDEVETKVEVLESGQAESRRAADLFAMVDRDVADLKQAFSAQRHVLQALRDTQLEQGRTLVQHGQALGAIVVTLESMQETQRSMQDEMRSMQETQRSMQETQRSMQETQRSMQDEMRSMRETQGSMLGDMRSMRESLADHGRILARLDRGDQGG
jgi:chromosome segregation ATPase